MPITVVCHKCGTLATVPDSAAGMQGKCERCGNVILVPGGIVKCCCVCHVDVSNTQRTKDAAGNYYCTQCAKAKHHAIEASATAKPSATPEPGSASESAICVICKADFPRKSLCNFDGDLVCNACARHAGLGTASYRTKKMRWSGVRLVYRCPQCQGELESTLGEAGKEDRCPQCGAAFDVPGRYEKLKATRPTAVSMPQGTAVAAAPAPAASQPAASPETSAGPPPKAVMGKGKLLAISASAVGAVLALAFMINHVVTKPNTTSPQAKPATTQANAAKPAATQAVATAKATKVQAATAATKPVAAKETGGNAGAKAAAARLAAEGAAKAKAAAARLAAANAAKARAAQQVAATAALRKKRQILRGIARLEGIMARREMAIDLHFGHYPAFHAYFTNDFRSDRGGELSNALRRAEKDGCGVGPTKAEYTRLLAGERVLSDYYGSLQEVKIDYELEMSEIQAGQSGRKAKADSARAFKKMGALARKVKALE